MDATEFKKRRTALLKEIERAICLSGLTISEVSAVLQECQRYLIPTGYRISGISGDIDLERDTAFYPAEDEARSQN